MDEREAQARQTAVQIADRRAGDGAKTEDVVREAELVLKFLLAGQQAAEPERS